MIRRTAQPHVRVGGFTLIEMIVVIAIIAILVAVGAGMVGNTSAQARRTATDTVSGLVEQARTTAITSRSPVALVLLAPGELPGGDGRARAGLVRLDDWSGEGADAVLLSRWQHLPNGVVPIGGSSDSLRNPLDDGMMTLRIGGREARAAALVFHPRGGLQWPPGSDPMILRLAEGAYRDGVAVPVRREGRVAETRVRVGRVVARPYRLDG